MRYLVTGYAGFIGSNVAALLSQQGHEVVGVDDLNDAYDPRLKAWRRQRLADRYAIEMHDADVRDLKGLEPLFSAGPFDGVFHLAARAGVRQSMVDPWIYHETNGRGTLNLLELCRRHDTSRIILASTSSLYGAHNQRPFREDADTSRPLSPYAASKKAAEAYCASYNHLYGISTPVLRYFTVYGPAGRPDMSIFRFIRWIATGRPIVLYGDGSQERDFTYVEDIARGTVAALDIDGFEVVNLGNDRPVSLRRVIEILEGLLGKKALFDQRPVHPADVASTWASIEKANRMLDWQPHVGIEEGLARTVQWWNDEADWAATVDLGE